MTYKERLLKVLDMKEVDRPPVAVPTQSATVGAMKETGVFWPDALRKADPMAKLAMGCQIAHGFESIRLPFDINIEAETMGCETRYGGEEDPPMSKPKNNDELDQLLYPDPLTSGRMAEVIKAVEIVAGSKDEDMPLIVALGTSFEVLCTIYNFEQMYVALTEEEGKIMDMLEKILELQTSYAKALMKAGAEVMMIVDGTSQTLAPKHFEKYSYPFTKRLIEVLDRPSILHICGNPSRLVKVMAETGANALSIDWPVPIDKAREDAAGKCALVGNLNVQTLFTGGPEDAVEMVEAANAVGLDIIAPGCGILPGTPIENVRAYVKAVKSIN